MKNILMAGICCILLITSKNSVAQKAKNTAGIFAGIEWNTLSGLTGVTYERSIYNNNNVVFGLKGIYIFNHQNGNLQLISRTYSGASSAAIIMATANYFTNKQNKETKGFYLYSGLGLAQQWNKFSSNKYITRNPALELGFGWRLKLTKGSYLNLSSGINFAGNGGITLSKLSVSF